MIGSNGGGLIGGLERREAGPSAASRQVPLCIAADPTAHLLHLPIPASQVFWDEIPAPQGMLV